jgi:Rhodopirellula transposase DDE domain
VCRTVPYGIYDVTKNKGYVYVGTSADTTGFAVDAIARWWAYEGRIAYPGVNQLLILADGGGSNGWRVRTWKEQLQVKLCDKLGLIVTVCHYPPGCSKWNPVERRLFSFISMNWAGNPLRVALPLTVVTSTSAQQGV